MSLAIRSNPMNLPRPQGLNTPENAGTVEKSSESKNNRVAVSTTDAVGGKKSVGQEANVAQAASIPVPPGTNKSASRITQASDNVAKNGGTPAFQALKANTEKKTAKTDAKDTGQAEVKDTKAKEKEKAKDKDSKESKATGDGGSLPGASIWTEYEEVYKKIESGKDLSPKELFKVQTQMQRLTQMISMLTQITAMRHQAVMEMARAMR